MTALARPAASGLSRRSLFKALGAFGAVAAVASVVPKLLVGAVTEAASAGVTAAQMSFANSMSSLNGLFKEVYSGRGVLNMVYGSNPFLRRVDPK